MWMALTAIASLALGQELTRRIWPDALSGIERAAYAFLLGTAAWIASTWLLALAHLLVPAALIARTIVFAAAAALLVWKRGGQIAGPRFHPALVPVIIWLAFILWRGTVVPPLTHDALAYHLPKAVLFTRAHGYDPLWQLGFQFTRRPANYEMLLADSMAMDGGDGVTEWLGAIFYLGYVIAGAALASRWWPNARVALPVALFLAAIPVALLHSGADKNDLMAAFFMVAAMLAAGRTIALGETRDVVMTLLAGAAAVGTKTHGVLVIGSLAPFILWCMIRGRWSAKRLAAVAASGALAFILLGGVEYVVRFLPHPNFPVQTVVGDSSYGEWSNLWKGVYVLLAQPLNMKTLTLWVPWSAKPWYWPRYEIYFSHLGAPFTLCALLLPLGVFKSPVDRERLFVSLATLVSFLGILPFRQTPDGIYLVGLPRFVLYVVPVVFAWTLGPVIATEARRARMLVAAGVVFFVFYALEAGWRDRFCPLNYVAWAAAHPGTRLIPFHPNRAASVVDRIAGPDDSIAMDLCPSAWIHPAFGSRLTRPVSLIPPGGAPDPAARWIVIDRAWSVFWGDPRFKDLGDWTKFLGGGTLRAEDRRMFEMLRGDPRYQLVFFDPGRMQAVFRRR